MFAIILVVANLSISSASAAKKVGGYMKKNGTYVQSYYKSDSDSYKFNNYSTKGNSNPYTGKKGYKKYNSY